MPRPDSPGAGPFGAPEVPPAPGSRTVLAVVIDAEATQPGNGDRRTIRQRTLLLVDDEFLIAYHHGIHPAVASTAHTFPATTDAPARATVKADVVGAVEGATGADDSTNDEGAGSYPDALLTA